jgi:hypothetical protein
MKIKFGSNGEGLCGVVIMNFLLLVAKWFAGKINALYFREVVVCYICLLILYSVTNE